MMHSAAGAPPTLPARGLAIATTGAAVVREGGAVDIRPQGDMAAVEVAGTMVGVEVTMETIMEEDSGKG